ncbi:STAS domain-containing protein [Actinokineospora sp. HUAS TT18]|uniref:STAS domain-containing protein n=1 Tax=Actinokineospora sp. HUAS TT18 TaxID=3447451 RepID=UPI003F524E1A
MIMVSSCIEGHLVVRVGGRIAVDTVYPFAETLGAAASSAPYTDGMIIDLTGVRSLGAHGLGVLTKAAGHGRDVGYPLVLVAPPGSTAAHTLELAATDHVLPVVESLDDAHAVLGQRH